MNDSLWPDSRSSDTIAERRVAEIAVIQADSTAMGEVVGGGNTKPTIKVVKGAIHHIVDAVDSVLSNPEVGIFARGDVLVRPTEITAPCGTLTARPQVEGNIARPDGSIIIGRIEPEALTEELTRRANFAKLDRRAKDWLPCDCPSEVSRTYMARRGYNWSAPKLRTIIQAPCLRNDGTVINAAGYDPATGLLFLTKQMWPAVPKKPSQQDAGDAVDLLSEPLKGLPFVADSDKSAALALLITAVLRPSLKTAPLFAVTAPSAGTGKSLTVDIASILATGRPAAVITPSPDESELEKRLGAAALAGDPVMCLDNVSATLRSDFLCSFLTQSEVQVRVLGKSENQRIPSTSLVCATGNNLQIFGDLNRRTILIRLDAEEERPDEREFSFDAREIARRDRLKLVTAALTIVRAYIVAGRPKPASPMGSFEDWSEFVRSALMWANAANGADPRGDVTTMRAEDPEVVELGEIIEALPLSEFSVRSIKINVGNNDEMKSALGRFIDRSGNLNAKAFGQYLKRNKDRPIAGRKIKLVKSDLKHGSTWSVVSVESSLGVVGVYGGEF